MNSFVLILYNRLQHAQLFQHDKYSKNKIMFIQAIFIFVWNTCHVLLSSKFLFYNINITNIAWSQSVLK